MAKSRQKMLDKMDHYDAITPVSRHVNFNIPNPGPVAGGWGIRLVGVGFAYPDRPTLFDGVEFSINQTSRIVLVGPNGIGKSTLLNVIYQVRANLMLDFHSCNLIHPTNQFMAQSCCDLFRCKRLCI